ncbi:MAG: DMT family transporter [Candidatus Woesearchaeota archaeon]
MKKGLMLVLATAVISGVSIFLNKFAVSGINSSVFTFSKNVAVALLIFSIIVLFGRLNEVRQLTTKQWSLLAAVGLIGGSIPFLLFFKGLQVTSSVTGSFIHKTMFVFVAVLAVIFLKEKLNKTILAAAALLVAGNFFLLGINTISFDTGTLLILAATALWAGENVLSKHLLGSLSGNIVAFGRMFFGSLFILAFLAASGQLNLVAELTSKQLLWILATSLLLLFYVVTWYNGLKEVKVTVAASILTLGLPITTLLNFAAGSAVTLHEITGIIMVAAGVTIASLFSKVSLQHSRSAQ